MSDSPCPSPVMTSRLALSAPTPDDVDGIFAICSDPGVWSHFPSLRHTERSQSAAVVDRWTAGWRANALDTWIVREHGDSRIIGYGGCSMLGGAVWNLGYRLAPAVHGRGYATEVSRAAIAAAAALSPDLPVIAYLVEHNAASARVAEKLGFILVHRAPDAGNPDPDVMRLVYADRLLDEAQLAAALAWAQTPRHPRQRPRTQRRARPVRGCRGRTCRAW